MQDDFVPKAPNGPDRAAWLKAQPAWFRRVMAWVFADALVPIWDWLIDLTQCANPGRDAQAISALRLSTPAWMDFPRKTAAFIGDEIFVRRSTAYTKEASGWHIALRDIERRLMAWTGNPFLPYRDNSAAMAAAAMSGLLSVGVSTLSASVAIGIALHRRVVVEVLSQSRLPVPDEEPYINSHLHKLNRLCAIEPPVFKTLQLGYRLHEGISSDQLLTWASGVGDEMVVALDLVAERGSVEAAKQELLGLVPLKTEAVNAQAT